MLEFLGKQNKSKGFGVDPLEKFNYMYKTQQFGGIRNCFALHVTLTYVYPKGKGKFK